MPPGGAYGQGGVPRYPPLPAGFPGGAQGAQGFSGSAHRIPPRAGSTFEELSTPSVKEELKGVNRCVRQLYAKIRGQRLDGALADHEIQPNKPVSSDLDGSFKGVQSTQSDLEKFLRNRFGADATPFDPRVREHVGKEFPEFYRRYATPEAVGAALFEHGMHWFV